MKLFTTLVVECQTVVYKSSLSMIVLNSRYWSEIVWLPEILRFKNQPCNRLYPKNPLECIG